MLNLYKTGSAACSTFKEITEAVPELADPFYDDQGYKKGLPWLYYDRPADEVIYQDKRVKFHASFNYENLDIGVVSHLRFKIASYLLDGTFLGFEDLTDQLIICSKTTEEL